MRAFFGPVEGLGHPFYPHPMELVVERKVGPHELYCFSRRWSQHGPVVEFDDVDAVVVWDPMWLTYAELERVFAAVPEGCPKVGVFGDWFAGFHASPSLLGTVNGMFQFDTILVDPAGAPALRSKGYLGGLVLSSRLVTYGRLVGLGAEDPPPVDLDAERPVDVCHIGNRHANQVVLRPYYNELVEEICDFRGWSFDEAADVPWLELEGRLLAAKAVFNHALGSQFNCRVYEALAAGCALVTDAHTLGADELEDVALVYDRPAQVERRLERAITGGIGVLRQRERGLEWAKQRSPGRTWMGVFDAVEGAL